MAVLRSLLFYVVFYLGSVFYVLASLIAIPFGTGPLRKAVRGWSGFHRDCAKWLLGIEVIFEGGPIDEPALYAIKHESFFEAIDMPKSFGNPVVFAKKELFAIPGWGRAARTYGLVPVAREEGAKALLGMIREARQKAAEGRPLVIFPEGTRIPHGETAKLQSGFSGLYKMVKLPVVPVAVNSGPLYHRPWKRPGQITYRFGTPIPSGLERDEVERRVTEAINRLN